MSQTGAMKIRNLAPVLPVPSRQGCAVPFLTAEELLAYNRQKELSLAQLAIEYEAMRACVAPETVVSMMQNVVRTALRSVEEGKGGTYAPNRILPCQTPAFEAALRDERLIPCASMNEVISCVSALMEVKSSMGVIVAAPTAGACGALPGAIIGVSRALRKSPAVMAEAFLAAGLIGVFVAERSTFAAEVCGCQAE